MTTEGSVVFSADSFHCLLIYDQGSIDSFETVYILNYFGFGVEIEMENIRKKGMKEMGFSKEDSYPFLIINSSDVNMPPVQLSSKDAILAHLFNNGFIGSYKTQSAFEKQGLLMVQEVFEPAVEDLMTDWKTLLNFHSRM